MATNDVETIVEMEEVDTKNVIRRYFKRLSNQLAVSSDLLLSVSVGFYQCNIVDLVAKTNINNKGGLVGADILLTSVHMKVEQSPNDYLVPVMNVLRDEVALSDTVRKMENYLAGRPSSDSSGTQQSTSEAAMDDPASVVSFVPATSVADTVSAAERLRECFERLLFSVIVIASRGKINLDWLKVKISLHLQCTRENTSPDVQDHLTELQKCSNPVQVVTFLIDKNFLGYLNFYLLKPFKEVISNEGFGKKCQDYQSKHNLFVKNNFQFIVKAFRQNPEISPASVIGLPKMTVELTTPWESKSLYQWKEIVSKIVEWGEYIIIKDIDINCVLITYQIMPFILPRIIQDLTDDVIINKFRAVGATFTIPPDVMEMGVADREWITSIVRESVLLKKPHPLEEPSNDAHPMTESPAQSLEEASGYVTQAVVEGSEPRLDKMREIVEQVPIGLFNTNYRLDKTSEMVGPEQGPIQLFSTIKDDIAKMEKESETVIHNMDELEECLKDPNNMVPVYPLLVIVTGMSKTGKTESLKKSFKVTSEQNAQLSHHEFVISEFPSTEIFHVARDESFLCGIQNGLKYCLKNVSAKTADLQSADNVLNDIAKFLVTRGESKPFEQGETLQNLSTSSKKFGKLLTHGIGFLNMWDTSLHNKTIRPILEFFGGCFTRSNLWLFVDLDDDIDTFNLPPGGTAEIDSRALGFRSQLVYLLRQCQLCNESMYHNDTHKVCTIFATYKCDSHSLIDPQKKKNDLQDVLEEAARQMGVDELIDFKIVLIDQNAKWSRDMKSKLGKALNRIMPKRIPLSWLYLRHNLAQCNELCIERTELESMSVKCGLPQYGLQEFLDFFTSFGSILDMKKFKSKSKSEYIIIKPYEFLLRCDKILRSESNNGNDGIIDINKKTDKEDELCISLMMSIGMGTEIQPTENMCYFPTIRNGKRSRRTIDKFAIQFITSLSSPAMQKPVSVIEALQNNLPNTEIHPEWTQDTANTAVVSTRQDGPDQTPLNIFLSFQGNIVEISLYSGHATDDATLKDAVRKIVRAFHSVAEEKSALYQCKVKYHFAVRCQQNDEGFIDCFPYHKHHVLPRTKFCEQCLHSGINNDSFIKAWITALTKDDVPESVRDGDLSVHNVSNFVEEVSKCPIDAIHLVSSELGEHVEKYFQKEKDKKGRMWLVLGMLHCWQSVLDEEDESPKKVLARILVAVDKKWREKNKNESNFGKLAQKIDMQVLTEHQKGILKKFAEKKK